MWEYGKMNVGIICASDEELAPFLKRMELYKTSRRAMLTIYEGNFGGTPAAVLYSGVCKVNAAVAAQILIDFYNVGAVINGGTAGGMAPDVELFDTVVCERTAYHDVSSDILTDFHPWLSSIYFEADSRLLERAKAAARQSEAGGRRVHFGTVVSGEQFIEDDFRDEINKSFAPLCVDMETAAIAHVCHVNGIPFLAVRSITDTLNHRGAAAFEENCARASEISADFIEALLKM